jgi:outer membrane immunogenic protein
VKKLSIALTVLAWTAGTSFAADLPAATYTKAPAVVPPLIYSWTGFYIGANGGGGWGETSWEFADRAANSNHSISGGMAGGQIGYNWQFSGPWVLGAEADGDWANIKGGTPCVNPIFQCTSEARALASFRGRFGGVVNNVLFYGTAGGAYANSHYTALINGLPSAGSGFFDSDRWGYAAGAGIEWAFVPNWSAKLEYMHYGFGAVTAPLSALGGGGPNLKLNIDTVRVGINYHFNSGPIVARY